ncbi:MULTISPECIES: hypothetical protein [Streptosporangium]|uniref:Transcriptional coactivator p15 (PC4) C-terminal domain-containing protein n=1 Tax=Streptosporangium brasiliense TaxID=47480 RepID=A0ABT9RMN4_9ACTN|nr:hypothetical protein [Streptosporangium brasiliense]MDP9870338.1 hypothetical protein [Streptosporangium brasiliense]
MAETRPVGRRKIYFERRIHAARPDKRTRLAVLNFAGHDIVELRDFVEVPKEVGGATEWRASSGYLLPMDCVIAVREGLQQIEADYGLKKKGASEGA